VPPKGCWKCSPSGPVAEPSTLASCGRSGRRATMAASPYVSKALGPAVNRTNRPPPSPPKASNHAGHFRGSCSSHLPGETDQFGAGVAMGMQPGVASDWTSALVAFGLR
jgi:hypothetical protein